MFSYPEHSAIRPASAPDKRGFSPPATGLVALIVSERRIAAENVIQERMKWRDTIRGLAAKVHTAFVASSQTTLAELHADFTLRLNPHHQDDQAILALIRQDGNVTELNERIALLLKHDWERGNYEASLWRRWVLTSPQRVTYQQYLQERQQRLTHNYRTFSLYKLGSIVVVLLIAVGIFWGYQCTHYFARLCQFLCS